MNTKEMIGQIANRTGVTKVKSEELLNACVSVIQKQLLTGKCVSLPNLGTLEMKRKNARVIVHPKSGERTAVPEKMQLVFKPTIAVKEQLKNL